MTSPVLAAPLAASPTAWRRSPLRVVFAGVRAHRRLFLAKTALALRRWTGRSAAHQWAAIASLP